MEEKSRWVEIRDSIVEALKVEEIGKDLKSRFVGWLTTEGIGFIQPIADAIIDECIEWDGIAHFIARYDGDEIELNGGFFAYRIN
jgi:hypothetical protein